MSVNVPGIIAILVFYLLILGVGLWAARKSKGAGTSDDGTTESEDVMLAGRNIGMLVGVFTMTGKWKLLDGLFSGECLRVYHNLLLYVSFACL